MMNQEACKLSAEKWRRVAVLRGLARGFTYPDQAWVATLLDGSWPSALAAALKPWDISTEAIQGAIDQLPLGRGVALRVLQVEYTYLFINSVPHVPAPPYASAYTGHGWLMGPPAEAALRSYQKAGLGLREGHDDLPDHLATELEFAAWLGEQAIRCQEAGDEGQAEAYLREQHAFLSSQVRPWLPTFCERVEVAARVAFYRELARLAVRALCSDYIVPEEYPGGAER